MNPNAKAFTFNPGASSFTPPSDKPAPTAVTDKPAPTAAKEEVDGDEAIDEDDPLWKATLVIAGGDRAKAVKLLEDPDALMQYPEVRAIMEGSGGDELEEWEKVPDTKVSAETVAAPVPVIKETPKETHNKAAAPPPAPDADEGGDDSAITLKDSDPREHINLVFIGHVDAGKSTLSGSILYIMGKVDKRTIERFEREAKERNRESWFLAFIMDTSEEERAKGKTVEVGRAHFETEKNRYTILDAPGHKNYVPNMISGAAQADIAVLVISARKGEFETGFEKGGQTREHALLAKTLGVDYLVVVVNKMDDPTVEWDVNRYEECVGKIKPYLKQCGYVIKKEVKFIPISGLAGDNVRDEVKPEKCAWWKAKYMAGEHNTTTATLLGTLDSLIIGGRNPDGPLRIPCLDRYTQPHLPHTLSPTQYSPIYHIFIHIPTTIKAYSLYNSQYNQCIFPVQFPLQLVCLYSHYLSTGLFVCVCAHSFSLVMTN